MGRHFATLDSWQIYVLTSDELFREALRQTRRRGQKAVQRHDKVQLLSVFQKPALKGQLIDPAAFAAAYEKIRTASFNHRFFKGLLKNSGRVFNSPLIIGFLRCLLSLPERKGAKEEQEGDGQILYSSQAGTGYSAQSLRVSSYERTPSEALAEKREQEATPVAKYMASFMLMPLYAP